MPRCPEALATVGRVLDSLVFDNRFTSELPGDVESGPRRRQVTNAAYSRVLPTPVADPRTMAWSTEMVDLLGLSADICASPEFAEVFGGNRTPDGADPFAACYGGHQFGNWAGQLGDGRAIALGEVIDREGRHQTLQLKGAGPTPYSRSGDGRAVLRSSIREFLCSETMHHLGVPTTRALSLVTTGDAVLRDMLYDGNVRPEPGAVVCRVAPSFVRFGTFQLPAARGDVSLLRQLVDFTIEHDFPHIAADGGSPDEQCTRWFTDVCERTAALVVHWMRIGFVHGVLNTDNMSILGLTIDYGPYGWLEDFDPGWTPNTTDAATHRYAFGAQPQIAHWNLVQLANALLVLTDDVAPLQAAIERYSESYRDGYHSMMVERLGWGSPIEGDDHRLGELYELLQSTETDYVLFFRDLADVPTDTDATDDALLLPLANVWYQPHELEGDVRSRVTTWLRGWGERVRIADVEDDERRRVMNSRNPRFVLRNSLAQEAIDAAEGGDASLIHTLLDVLRRPYDEQPGRERFAQRRPEWARTRVGCSALSCSS